MNPSPKHHYEVIVGNIGYVHSGYNPLDARTAYGEYKRQSVAGYGRAAHEPVTVMKDGELLYEYNPPRSQTTKGA